ncbi:MAG: hypothetical protein WAN10_05365 [Candidatus Acidiferrales bacterium]
MPANTKPHSLPRQPRSSQDAQRAQRQAATSLARHARKCAICNHPHRAAIDDDFVSWRSESSITLDYQLPSRSSVYRHAAATGILLRRRLNLRGVAERILERVDEAPPTAATILRAMRIFAQITEDGQWVEPAKRSIVTHIHITQHAPANHSVVGEPSVANRPLTTVEDSSASPSESPVAAACPRTQDSSRESETPVPSPDSRSVTDRKMAPQHGRRTPLHLDYLPRWAAGLSNAEILIGTQNTDPETVSTEERGT